MRETFGQKLKALRESASMTQVELAERLGVSRSAVGMYERDQREPDLDMIEAIADVFNVSMAMLTERKEEPQPISQLRLDRLIAIFNRMTDENQAHFLALGEIFLRSQGATSGRQD